jgi:hypothetical protein
VLLAAGVLSSCTFTPTTRSGSSGLPSLSSVVRDRFVAEVTLDNGALVVEPPGETTGHISADKARTMFHAADVVNGPYRFSVLGLGETTVAPRVSTPTTTAGTETTTTVTGTGTGAPGTTSPSTSSTTSTASSPVTTTTASAGTGAPATSTSTTIGTPLARYVHRLAWVGIVWGPRCPATTGKPPRSTRYIVVVFDAATGGNVLAYTSRGAATCTGPAEPAGIIRPAELVSVPWQPVGPASTAVRVTMPPCGTFYGWTDVPRPVPASIQVVARAPFARDCGSKAPVTQVVDGVVPLGNTQAQVPHAAVGPIDGLRTLAGA